MVLRHLANGWIASFINGNSAFNNGPRSLRRNPPGCTVLDNCVCDRLMLADKLFAKDLQRFATCPLVNNNLCGKLV